MTYLYTFSWHVNEAALCQLEMRALFGQSTSENVLQSDVEITPSRSPFMRMRLDVSHEAVTVAALCEQLSQLTVDGTFRVMSLNDIELGQTAKHPHASRREIERDIAMAIDGEPELEGYDQLFGVAQLNETFYFGRLEIAEHMWLRHQNRPQQYSTALGTKLARALVNIAAPFPTGKRLIDPCCGVGTVLIEALSMGIDILGRDMNWHVTTGSRKNIAHFGYEGEVQLGPIEDITAHYDIAIIDMPYNVFTHSTDEAKQSIITSARRIASRVVFVSSEAIEEQIAAGGFTVIDRCDVRKQSFVRTVFVCE